MATDVIVVIVV